MLIKLQAIEKTYPGQKKPVIQDINFSIDEGESFAIFGDSGSGKSTIGHILAGILKPSKGTILYKGNAVNMPYHGPARKNIQILFQHPEVSFNPKLTLIDSMKEPYRFFGMPYSKEQLLEFLSEYGIYDEHLRRYPYELSGGELQRLALARIMLIDPELIVLDEATSMLDVISQAQIFSMLKRIRQQTHKGFLLISHDPELCKRCSDRMEILSNGRLHKY